MTYAQQGTQAATESACEEVFRAWHERVAWRVARLQAVQGDARLNYKAPLRAYFDALWQAFHQARDAQIDGFTRNLIHGLFSVGFSIGEIIGGAVELKALLGSRLEATTLRASKDTAISTPTGIEAHADRVVQAVSVTCGKVAQQKIRHTEKNFERLLEESDWGMFTADPHGLLTYVNPALRSLLHLDNRDALLGQPFPPEEFWVHAVEREEFMAMVAKQRPFSRELTWRRCDGEKIGVIVSVTFGPPRPGPVEEIKGIVHDISQRRRIEQEVRERNEALEAANKRFQEISARYRSLNAELEQKVADRTSRLQDSERFYRSVLDSIRDAIIIVDRKFQMTFMNKSPEFGLGKSRQSMLGHTCYQTFRKQSEVCSFCPARKTFATGEPGYSQHNAWKDDGTEYFVELFTFPVMNESGEVGHVIEYVRDVTKRRAMEQQLIRNEKLAIAGTLAAGVAHEVNNPLASISSLVQFLQQEDVAPQQRESLQTIFNQVTRISGILQDLVSFARPRAAAYETTDINDLIEQTLRLIAFNREFVSITVTTELDGSLPRIMANRDQIQQVLIDMLLNAADALSQGGAIRVRSQLRRGSSERDEVHIEIEDNGCGIAEEHLDSIFNPFFSTKPTGKGTGLGLSVCHGIIDAHDGRIDTWSALGQGTRFTVILPVRQDHHPLAQPGSAAS